MRGGKKKPTFDGAKEAAAVGVHGHQVELGPREHLGVRVDVVDGELDGELRGAANRGVVREEGAHGHLARPRPRRRRRPRSGGGSGQEHSNHHQLSHTAHHQPQPKRRPRTSNLKHGGRRRRRREHYH